MARRKRENNTTAAEGAATPAGGASATATGTALRSSPPPATGTAMTPPRTGPRPPVPETPPPTHLGHYEVQEKLGQGGMAIVYKGVQPSLNRTVAIKILPPQFASTPEMLGRFEREASIVAQLNHSNIVQVIDRGQDGNLLYIVMEYVDGDSLDKMIRASRIELAQVVDIASQICDGLDYAHSVGVVHRDLKPANILIDRRNGRVKIADFGIAQLETTGGPLATLTYDNASIGTMNYMSPEQRLDSHRVTYLTDIFSFGVILYEMLTGKLPIGHFKLPSLVRPEIPMGFDGVVKRCLAESPADRYQNASEIRRELAQLFTRRRTAAPPGMAFLSRLNKRQRWYAFAGMGAAVLLFLVLLGIALKHSPASGPSGSRPDRPAEPATPGSGKQTKEAEFDADFARASGLISNGKRADAALVLAGLVRQYPQHVRAAEAQFALASAYYDMGEKEKCKLEYERLIRQYPNSPRVTEAILGKCTAEWETSPRKARLPLLKSGGWDGALQSRLVEELRDLLARKPPAPRAVAALKLIAKIAEPPQMANLKLAADSLVSAHQQDPAGTCEELYHAAELYDREIGDAKAAAETYDKFVRAFPNDKRVEKTLDRIKRLHSS